MALKKKVTSFKSKGIVTQNDLISMAREYNEISEQMKVLEKKKKDLADKIKTNSEKFGTKDDKGSYYFESDEFITGKVSSKSFSLNQEKAKERLEELGLWDDLKKVTVTETVNEELLEQYVSEGKLDFEVVESFTNVKETFKVSVTKKEALPEVEQTVLKAARKK